jgi:hypothetical protein
MAVLFFFKVSDIHFQYYVNYIMTYLSFTLKSKNSRNF